MLASVWFTMVLLVITVGTLAAMFGRGGQQVFWRGFAVTGWICVVVTFSPLLGQQIPPPLLTSQGVLWVDDYLAGEEEKPQQLLYTTGHYWREPWDNGIRIWDANAGTPQGQRAASFQQIGQCILTLVFTLAGAVLARYLHSRNE